MLARIERHALASNASSFDTAWRTFGWSPGLAGEPASRLEEQVPWATRTAAAETPARLSGRAQSVLAPDNADRLDYAFQALDGRYALSTWGAIGERRGPTGEWRVLTHTLLFDEDVFRAIDGFPFGLPYAQDDGDVRPADWFRVLTEETSFDEPVPLEAIELRIDDALRHRMRLARLREIDRLRTRLTELLGAATRVEARLGGLYEALARVRTQPGPRHVALRASPQPNVDPSAQLLARLVWLSLPIRDRITTWFTTEHRKAQKTRATMLVLPAAEWGSFVPEDALLVEGRPRKGVAPGRAFWATVVMSAGPAASDPGAARLLRLDGKASARGWSMLDRDDFERTSGFEVWRHEWRSNGPSRELAEKLAAIEAATGGRPRSRALGHVAALAASAGDEPFDDWLLRLARGRFGGSNGGGPADVILLRSAIRTLQSPRCPGSRQGPQRRDAGPAYAAGVLRCRSVATGAVSGQELVRLAGPESGAGRALLRRASGREALAAAAEAAFAGAPGSVLPLIDLMAREGCPVREVAAFAQRLFVGAGQSLAEASPLNEATSEALLRLLWSLPDGGADAAAALLAAAPERGFALLAELMVAPAPLPTFLAIRRLLLSHSSSEHRVASAPASERGPLQRAPALASGRGPTVAATVSHYVAPSLRARIAEYSPALASNLES